MNLQDFFVLIGKGKTFIPIIATLLQYCNYTGHSSTNIFLGAEPRQQKSKNLSHVSKNLSFLFSTGH